MGAEPLKHAAGEGDGELDLILVVNDSLMQGHVLRQILEAEYQVELCNSGIEAMELAQTLHPSLILLDVVMPEMDGFDVLLRLKQDAATRDIPVILVTSLSNVGYEEKGLTLGAVDYIMKPFNASVVRARVRTHTELYRYRKAMEKLVRIDGLTGIPNRRYFDERCQEEWHRALRRQTPLSVGMLDIDYFKQYNDCYGHPSGDQTLRTVAQLLDGTLKRTTDFAARFGGEEFGFLMPATPAQLGERLAGQIRQDIEQLQIPHIHSRTAPVLTVSIGGATVVPQPGLEFSTCLKTVDDMLYCAKDQGRNGVVWTQMN